MIIERRRLDFPSRCHYPSAYFENRSWFITQSSIWIAPLFRTAGTSVSAQEIWSIRNFRVDGLCTGVEGGRRLIIMRSSQATAEQLMDILKRLPSFHEAFFAPALLG
jgi:hypothetical protein